ncbi:hypothetical protein ANN_21439 [Periplaneta americana]|uniref:DDE-1 domain-containing protein n=1 Tax=Periplaneta americana TaxID=6978 RepID=A0ABQ8SG52_PERAM|nr:hypothetical protein ANN_21439 [Periplaneta americana]
MVHGTGLSTVQKRTRKVIAKKGKQQVGSIASVERGMTTTAVCCASAAGQYIPPMLIFKRTRAKDELMDGAPPGTVFAFNPDSGYIYKELFVKYLHHFIDTVKLSNDHKVLLLLDGHTTHSKNPEALDLARQCRVVAELFGKAYGRAATVGTAINGFVRAGVWPVDRDVFKNHHFSTATVLQPSPVVEEVPVAKDTSTGTKSTASRTTVATCSITEKIPAVEATTSTKKTSTVGAAASTNTAAINPMCEKVPGAEATGNESAGGAATQIKVTEAELSPLPKAATAVASTRGKKGTQKALVLTSSPYKQQLSKSSTVAAIHVFVAKYGNCENFRKFLAVPLFTEGSGLPPHCFGFYDQGSIFRTVRSCRKSRRQAPQSYAYCATSSYWDDFEVLRTAHQTRDSLSGAILSIRPQHPGLTESALTGTPLRLPVMLLCSLFRLMASVRNSCA